MNEQQEIKYAQSIRNQRVDMFLKVTRGLEDLDLTNTETRKFYLSYVEQTEKTAMWVFEVEAFLNKNFYNLAFTRHQNGPGPPLPQPMGNFEMYPQPTSMMPSSMANNLPLQPYPQQGQGFVPNVPQYAPQTIAPQYQPAPVPYHSHLSNDQTLVHYPPPMSYQVPYQQPMQQGVSSNGTTFYSTGNQTFYSQPPPNYIPPVDTQMNCQMTSSANYNNVVSTCQLPQQTQPEFVECDPVILNNRNDVDPKIEQQQENNLEQENETELAVAEEEKHVQNEPVQLNETEGVSAVVNSSEPNQENGSESEADNTNFGQHSQQQDVEAAVQNVSIIQADVVSVTAKENIVKIKSQLQLESGKPNTNELSTCSSKVVNKLEATNRPYQQTISESEQRVAGTEAKPIPSYAQKVSHGYNHKKNTFSAYQQNWMQNKNPWRVPDSWTWTPKKTTNDVAPKNYHSKKNDTAYSKRYNMNYQGTNPKNFEENCETLDVKKKTYSDIIFAPSLEVKTGIVAKPEEVLNEKSVEPSQSGSVAEEDDLPHFEDAAEDFKESEIMIASPSSSSCYSSVGSQPEQKLKTTVKPGANKKKSITTKAKKLEKAPKPKLKEQSEDEDAYLDQLIAENVKLKKIRAEEAANELKIRKETDEVNRKKIEEQQAKERARQKKFKEEYEQEERKKYEEMRKIQEAFLNEIHIETDEEEDNGTRLNKVFAFDFKGGPATATHCARVLNGMRVYVQKLLAEKDKEFTKEEFETLPKFRKQVINANICVTETPFEEEFLQQFMNSRVEIHRASDVPGDSLRHILYVALSRNFQPCLHASVTHLLHANDGTKTLDLLETDFIRMLLEMCLDD